MCVRCWYLIDGWWRHGLCWRERSQLIRWTESSSCFGKVLASFSLFTVLVYLWFLCLDYNNEEKNIKLQGTVSRLRCYYAWWRPKCSWCTSFSVDLTQCHSWSSYAGENSIALYPQYSGWCVLSIQLFYAHLYSMYICMWEGIKLDQNITEGLLHYSLTFYQMVVSQNSSLD